MGINDQESGVHTKEVDVDALVQTELTKYGDIYQKWMDCIDRGGHGITPEGLARMRVSERLAFNRRYPDTDFSQVRLERGLIAEATPEWVDLDDPTTYEKVEDRLVDREEHARQLGGKPEDYGEGREVWRRVRYCRADAGVKAKERFLEKHFHLKDGETVFFAQAFDGTGARIDGWYRQYYAESDVGSFVAQLFEAARLEGPVAASGATTTETGAPTTAPTEVSTE